jgi:hypothetical protein
MNEYLNLVYGGKSSFQKMQDIEERKKAVCEKLGLKFEQIKAMELDKDFRQTILKFMRDQVPLKVSLLNTRQELFQEMMEKVREPLLQTKDEERMLKSIKLKADIDSLLGRLADNIDQMYKEIYQDKVEEAKFEVRRSVEERLKKV